jgi:hypothetical protein
MVYLITYDLAKPHRDYEGFIEAIKTCGGGWCHALESVWLLETDLDAQQIWSKLASRVARQDKLFITRMSGDSYGVLPERVWEWLNKAMSRAA